MADARNRSNVLVGAPDVKASGGLLIGDVQKTATNFPNDASSVLPTGLNAKPAGFIGEDGLTKTVDRSTEKIKDWNKDTVIVLETDHSVVLKLTFLESANANVLKAVYGKDNVTIEGKNITVADAAGELPHFSLVAEMNGGEGKKARIFVPDGQVTSVSDITFKKDDVIKYEVEIECFAVDNKKFIAHFEVPTEADSASYGVSPAGDSH
ncbi:hypothetical protein [Corynebacterium striatum]|jgi:hypothetical protein|uniref:phage tail tube protein n=1 Tax=Corynebacterium striatum TaxID=43770 RepID=UPI00101BF64A|nr:hypothetical protein [Corynebacterium striatum]